MHVIDGAKLGAKTKQKMADGVRPLLRILQPILDNRFALIHTLTVPGRREKVDALLVGPHGALVMILDPSLGRYRCLGDNWYVWDKKANNFLTAEENPMRELKQGQHLIETILSAQGLGTTVPVDGVVVFVSPKLQLEHMEPIVKLIEFNEIKAFATQLAATPVYIEQREIEKTLAVFGAQASIASTTRVAAPQGQAAQKASTLSRRGPFGLKRWQFYAVIGMAVACLLVLSAAVYVVINSGF